MTRAANSSTQKKRGRNAWLAALLNLLLPGLGSLYCRQDNKGVFLVGMSLLGHWSTGGVSSLVFCPAMAVDAFTIARKFNRGAAIGRWEFFPGIRALNSLPTRIMLLAIAALVAILTVAHIVHFASDYPPGQ